MIYFDNAATSYPKPRGLLMEMENCMSNYCGNPGRSGHYMSSKTAEEIYKTRKKLAAFLNVEKAERIVFTKNTTEALNIVFYGLLKNGDHVVTTSMEHNSVLRPLAELASRGVSYTIVTAESNGSLDISKLISAIKKTTKLIAITAASNVTGSKMPLIEVGKIARKNGIYFLIDGAQLIGAEPFDTTKVKPDFLAFPGHKGLLGAQGTGGLYVKEGIELNPYMCGGTGTESKNLVQPRDFPDGYESGTLNSPGIIGLGYSLDFINRISLEAIAFQEKELIAYLDGELRNMDFVEFYGPDGSEKVGISLFNIKGINGEEITQRLSNYYGIAVRGGFHCAGLAHKTIGTWDRGAVRVSVGPFNTRKEMGKLINAVWEMKPSKII